MSEETKEKDFDTLVRAYADSVGLDDQEKADQQIKDIYKEFYALYIKGSFNINDKDDRDAHTPFAERIAANPALFNALDAKVRLENDGEGIQERLAAAKNTYWVGDPIRKGWDYAWGQDTQEEAERKIYEPWGFKKGAGDKDWTRTHVPSAEQNRATSGAADKVYKQRKQEERARRGEEIAQMPPGPQKTEALMDLELGKTLDDIGYQDDPDSSPDDYNRLYNEPAEKSLDNPAPGQPGQPNAQAPAAAKDDSMLPSSEKSQRARNLRNYTGKMDDYVKSGTRLIPNRAKGNIDAEASRMEMDALKDLRRQERETQRADLQNKSFESPQGQQVKDAYESFEGSGSWDKLTPDQKSYHMRRYMNMDRDDPRRQGKTLDQPSGTMGGALQYTPPPLEEDMVPGEPGTPSDSTYKVDPNDARAVLDDLPGEYQSGTVIDAPMFTQPAPSPRTEEDSRTLEQVIAGIDASLDKIEAEGSREGVGLDNPAPTQAKMDAFDRSKNLPISGAGAGALAGLADPSKRPIAPSSDFAGASTPPSPAPTQAEAEAAGDPFLGMDAPALPEPEAYVSADTPMPKPAPRTPEEEEKFQDFANTKPTAHIIRQGMPQGQYKGFEEPNLDNIRHDPLDYQKTTDRGWWDRKNAEGEMVKDVSLERPVQSPYHSGDVAMSKNAQRNQEAYRRGASFVDPAVSTFNSTAQQGSAGKYSIRGPGGHLTDKIPVFGKNGIVGYRTKGLMRDEVAKQGMFTNPIVRGNQAEDERLKRKYGLEGTEFGNKYRPQYVA